MPSDSLFQCLENKKKLWREEIHMHLKGGHCFVKTSSVVYGTHILWMYVYDFMSFLFRKDDIVYNKRTMNMSFFTFREGSKQTMLYGRCTLMASGIHLLSIHKQRIVQIMNIYLCHKGKTDNPLENAPISFDAIFIHALLIAVNVCGFSIRHFIHTKDRWVFKKVFLTKFNFRIPGGKVNVKCC